MQQRTLIKILASALFLLFNLTVKAETISKPSFNNSTQPTENENDRLQRLRDAGIVPPLPPPPTPTPAAPSLLSGFGKELDKMSFEAKNEQNQLNGVKFRTELNLGTWFSTYSPIKTRLVPDFSYGVNITFSTQGIPLSLFETGNSQFVGFDITAFNGSGYIDTPDEWKTISPVFIETNSTQLGVIYSFVSETRFSELKTWGTALHVGYSPVRFIEAKNYTYLSMPNTSEGKKHFALNWGGVQIGLRGFLNIARLVEIGAFGAMYAIAPTIQIRSRVGITIALIERENDK